MLLQVYQLLIKIFTTTFLHFKLYDAANKLKKLVIYEIKCLYGWSSKRYIPGTLGYTHCSIEDIGVLRLVKYYTLSDTTELAKSIEQILKYDKPVYLRLIEIIKFQL